MNDFESFASEDEWANFLQTKLRLTDEVDAWDSFERFYTKDGRPGAGVHNTLHAIFSDPESSIDVLDSEVNLHNLLVWGIHGWIDSKWRAFVAAHPRSAEEQLAYEEQIKRFRLHMQLMSDEASGGHQHQDPVPLEVAASLKPINHAHQVVCENLDETTGAKNCAEHASGHGPGPRERD